VKKKTNAREMLIIKSWSEKQSEKYWNNSLYAEKGYTLMLIAFYKPLL